MELNRDRSHTSTYKPSVRQQKLRSFGCDANTNPQEKEMRCVGCMLGVQRQRKGILQIDSR